jgi:CBS domain containing-hemolysin-like protein
METGFVSALKPRIRQGVEKGERGAKTLLFFINRPGVMLATTLLGTNICLVCSSNMAKEAAASFGFESPKAFLATTIIMSLILMNAEILPKDWFRQSPYRRCRRFIGVFKIIYFILYIPSHILSAYTRYVNNFVSGKKDDKQDARIIIRKDFLLLLRESEKAGAMNANIAGVIDNALCLHVTKVSGLMIKRENVFEISSDMTLREAFDFCQIKKVSRTPVKHSGKGDSRWIGFFSIYDLIFNVDESRWEKMRVSECMRPIPEISLFDKVDNVFEISKDGASPILAVFDPGKPGIHNGIISVFAISEKLFGF